MSTLLSIRKITKRYANHTALNNVSFDVPKQSIFGLLGPNGAGKTSLIRIINQITAPDHGKVVLGRKALSEEDVRHIGYLPEERGLYKKMKVGEQSLYLAQLKGMPKKEAREKLKKWFIRFEIEGWWDKRVEELSKGMAQKIQFITTVLHEPKLLILDEPFSGFDPINTNIIKEEILRLRDEGATIILSTHNMSSVEEICDHIALINNSEKVLDGKVSDVKDQFRTYVYDIIFRGSVAAFTNAMWTGSQLISHEIISGDFIKAKIKINEGFTVNDVLNNVLPHVAISSINETIPSMNEIFIQVVNQPTKEETNG